MVFPEHKSSVYSYYPDQYDTASFEVSFSTDSKKIVVIRIKDKIAIAQLMRRGIIDPKLSYFGQPMLSLKNIFGEPDLDSSSFLGFNYTYFHRKVVAISFGSNKVLSGDCCNEFEVQWLY